MRISRSQPAPRQLPAALACAAAAWVLIAWGATSPAQVIRQGVIRRTPQTAPAGRPVPIVNADDDLAAFLAQAQTLIKQGKFREALDILQPLIDQSDGGFVAIEEGRRFISLARKANDVIGSMNEQGLELYRSLMGPKAQRLFEDARRGGDLNALRRVAWQYAHTVHGREALMMLAALSFDRGQYSQAAQFWREALQGRIDGAERAMLLARIAVCEHFSGDKAQAAKVLAMLREQFGEAQGFVGGRRQNLVEFVGSMMALAPAPPPWASQAEGDWPGLGGFSDGMATMSEADVVLSPHWRYPAAASSTLSPGDLIAADESIIRNNPAYQQIRLGMTLRRGVVLYRQQYGQQVREGIVPPLVQPVVMGSTVIFRTSSAVVACDIFSPTQPLWKVDFPMTGKPAGRNGAYYYYQPILNFDDGGRYALTCGEGKVFALGEFAPASMRMMIARGAEAGQVRDGSTLAAFSISDQGVNLWRLPNSQEKEDILNGGKFVSPPTYCRGRLYIVASYLDSYHLLCLDARSGALLWKTLVSQSPTLPMQYYAYGIGDLAERCSAPAVYEGRVFVLTNAGAVAAFDAESGQAVWAYQYDSAVNTSGENAQRMLMTISALHGGGGTAQSPMPRNPLIVCQGRLMCLPADSDQAMAFSVGDGQLLWGRSREGLRDLSAVDPQRVLLSGPGLAVLDTRDGKILSQPLEAKDITGRPAVSARCALASTEGKVLRFSLDNYTVTNSDLVDSAGLLGNLVSVDGKLIAANAAGVCAYLDYDRMHQRLTEQFDKAPSGTVKCDALFQRLRLSFNARRFAAALADADACAEMARQSGEAALVPQLATWRYRTLVALGNQAADREQMLAFFEKAQAAASTGQEKAHMLIRLAKCMDKLGRFDEAADLAQGLAETYPKEELVDVEIGADADLGGRLDDEMQRYAGAVIGQRIIEKLVEIQGPQILDKFDRLAKAALDDAAAKNDPAAMAAVAARWPHSAWADDALLTAAESWYRIATAASTTRPAEKTKAAMDNALASLATLAYMTASPLRPSATIALAMVHARSGKTAIPVLYCNLVRNLPPQTPIKFADIQGTLGELIRQIESGNVQPPGAVQPLGRMLLPAKELMTAGDKAIILRDQHLAPLRAGSCIFLRQNEHIVMFDAGAGDAEKAVRWKTKVRPLALLPMNQGAGRGFSMVAGMSGDAKVLMLVDKHSVIRLNAADGKILDETELGKLGVQGVLSMGSGAGVIVIADPTGGLSCLDIAAGKVRWQARVGAANDRNSPIVPIDPPEISSRFVLVRHRGSRLTCFDLATGKILNQWRGQNVDGCLGDGGLMATLVEGVVSMHDGSATETLWTRKYESRPGQQVLGIFGDRLFVAGAGSEVDVLSITRGGQLLTTLTAAKTSGFIPEPLSLSLVGDKIVGVYSLSNLQMSRGGGVSNYARGMILQVFDESGKRLWTASVDANPGNVYFASPAVPAQDQVLLMCQPASYSKPASLMIFSSVDGKELGKVETRGLAAPVNNETYIRLFMIGPPVLIGQRVCVESGSGVIIYGEK
ncbi:MAG: PQQ-binding-like beta-propeller repeat protein [Planctomycetaceae bacterium]|nr:PQQ-binding-like beta-propeller repeat protein [Planctomycetaceae bacterium]